ncbi:MAG TPA: nitroreductase family protein, partial [Tenuifilaceae bacterium]|nr:nitroreductase family protein [Tenuifilaceae bacterium]
MELNSTIKTILERKSVRSFENKPIGINQLELILKAGMAAPSARNLQPWAFIVVTDRDTMNTLADRLPYAKMLHEASA